jgi:hypothetical protein
MGPIPSARATFNHRTTTAGGLYHLHVRYMSSEVEPCVVWALKVSLPFLAAKLIED